MTAISQEQLEKVFGNREAKGKGEGQGDGKGKEGRESGKGVSGKGVSEKGVSGKGGSGKGRNVGMARDDEGDAGAIQVREREGKIFLI